MAPDDRYKQIFQLWKNERRTKELLEVKGGMYSTIRQQINSLENELKEIDSNDKVSSKIINDKIERLNKILRDLTKIRTHKIIHAILEGDLNTGGLAAEELDLVNSLNRIFEDHNKRSILGEITVDVSKDNAIEGDEQADFMTVRILEDLPEIIDAMTQGEDQQTFGPFKKEDIVKLPLVYAKALIMKNAADRVDLPNM
jgi:DNA replication initiation complex subunit (GINS family)